MTLQTAIQELIDKFEINSFLLGIMSIILVWGAYELISWLIKSSKKKTTLPIMKKMIVEAHSCLHQANKNIGEIYKTLLEIENG